MPRARPALPRLRRTSARLPVKISVLDDYFDTIRTLRCFEKLKGHEVTVWNRRDLDLQATRLKHAR